MPGVQLHYSRGTPPPVDRTALAVLPTPGRPRLQRFDDAQSCGSDDKPFGRLLKISIWARSDGSIDAIGCRSDRGVSMADSAIPRFIERSHSSGTRVGRTSRVQHLALRDGEEVVCVSGHMGRRRLLRLKLRTSHKRSLEWGLEKREAELEGGRAWGSALPLGAGWHLVGFAGALRYHEGIIQLAPIWARDDSPASGGLGGADGPHATTLMQKFDDDTARTDSSEDEIARYEDTVSSPSFDAASAAAAAVALQRAFGLIGCLAHPTIDNAAGFPPLAVDQFIEWIGGEGHPKVALFTRALAKLSHPEQRQNQRGGDNLHRFLPKTIYEDEVNPDECDYGNSNSAAVLSPTEPVTVSEWINTLWSASQSTNSAAEVRESAEWLLLVASEADAIQGFPSNQRRTRHVASSSFSEDSGSTSDTRRLQSPDSYAPRPQSSHTERRQHSHKQWAHWNLYVPKILPARRNKRDGFGGGHTGAALREGILAQLASKALAQRVLGSGCKSSNGSPSMIAYCWLSSLDQLISGCGCTCTRAVVAVASSAGIAPVDAKHVRLGTDDRGQLLTNTRRAQQQMVEQLLEALITMDEQGEGVLPAVDFRRALRLSGLADGTVTELFKQPELDRDTRGLVNYRSFIQQLLH